MRVLITAGNTMTPIDNVRAITNIFRGRTGARVAGEFVRNGHSVLLLTSFPESALRDAELEPSPAFRVAPYRFFDELQHGMEQALASPGFDALIHTAAVSDYVCEGAYAAAPGTTYSHGTFAGNPPTLVKQGEAKVKSDHGELWLRLVKAPKLVDMVRKPWGFNGIVVKFKLEVKVGPLRLLEIAEESRKQSSAELMVANDLADIEWTYLGPLAGEGYRKVEREKLPRDLRRAVQSLVKA